MSQPLLAEVIERDPDGKPRVLRVLYPDETVPLDVEPPKDFLSFRPVVAKAWEARGGDGQPASV